jgi:hypothetical protein
MSDRKEFEEEINYNIIESEEKPLFREVLTDDELHATRLANFGYLYGALHGSVHNDLEPPKRASKEKFRKGEK